MLEFIEHIPQLSHAQVMSNVFALEPDLVLVTTPNKEFNKFFNLREDEVRDPDHKFEYNTAQFEEWVRTHSSELYEVEVSGVKYPNPARILGQYKHKPEEF